MNIADLRREYSLQSLNEKDVEQNPFKQFDKWWQDALNSEIEDVNAMSLATAGNNGSPSARIVLMKGYDEKGFTFYTNYLSFKSAQLAENPKVCLLFYWKELERQVIINGTVTKLSEKENDEYFNSRPEGSKIGAWASAQSHVIKSREWLEDKVKEIEKQFENQTVPRPAYWGGYLVKPESFEFWQGRMSRLHDRIHYTLQVDGSWKIERLSP